MKTLGIIGGIGPESTIEYYRQIIDAYRAETGDGSYPPLILDSIDLQRMIGWFGANDLASVIDYLASELTKLARAGAEFGIIAANTPHIVFDEVQPRSPIPLISIVEATCRAATAAGMKRAGLFGTRFTMQSDFYPRVFSRAGIELVVPQRDDQEFIHDKYMNELVPGIFRDETREALLAIAARMPAIDGLILGGTELPLILRGESADGVPLLDTTRIHVREAVRVMTCGS